ncbi:MAG: transcriptional repressor [Oscillospiraceae bacterium]|nr:transcriptional repressor [Oscillospiraceae bacterium]
MPRKTGYQTKQKMQLLAFFEAHPDRHITAAALLLELKRQGISIGAATIYRQLEKLEAEGLVRRYALDDRGSACWQYTGGQDGVCRHHFHLKCTECGTLFHLDCGHLNEIAGHVAAEHGFRIDPARTVFYGICEQCRSKSKE